MPAGITKDGRLFPSVAPGQVECAAKPNTSVDIKPNRAVYHTAVAFAPRLAVGTLATRFIWWADGFSIDREISGDSESRADRAGDFNDDAGSLWKMGPCGIERFSSCADPCRANLCAEWLGLAHGVSLRNCSPAGPIWLILGD